MEQTGNTRANKTNETHKENIAFLMNHSSPDTNINMGEFRSTAQTTESQ